MHAPDTISQYSDIHAKLSTELVIGLIFTSILSIKCVSCFGIGDSINYKEYIKEQQFNFIRQTDIKHKSNNEV